MTAVISDRSAAAAMVTMVATIDRFSDDGVVVNQLCCGAIACTYYGCNMRDSRCSCAPAHRLFLRELELLLLLLLVHTGHLLTTRQWSIRVQRQSADGDSATSRTHAICTQRCVVVKIMVPVLGP